MLGVVHPRTRTERLCVVQVWWHPAPPPAATLTRSQRTLCAGLQTRYEFLEAIVRLAKAKYVMSGATSQISEAIKMLIDNHLP